MRVVKLGQSTAGLAVPPYPQTRPYLRTRLAGLAQGLEVAEEVAHLFGGHGF
jgi:hypothetical protein